MEIEIDDGLTLVQGEDEEEPGADEREDTLPLEEAQGDQQQGEQLPQREATLPLQERSQQEPLEQSFGPGAPVV